MNDFTHTHRVNTSDLDRDEFSASEGGCFREANPPLPVQERPSSLIGVQLGLWALGVVAVIAGVAALMP